jgi:two-component system chemotaxis sensor kinase CheA
MPLVPADPDLRVRTCGVQPVLVFSDERRAMGLMIDEIVDVVEEQLDFALVSSRPGLLGSAVIRGEATEIVDLGHFLPLAFDDWQRWNERRADAPLRNLLLVDDAVFFRSMLTPLLEAAGYDVTCVASAKAALAALGSGCRFDAVVADLDMPEMDGFDLAQRCAQTRAMPTFPSLACLHRPMPTSASAACAPAFAMWSPSLIVKASSPLCGSSTSRCSKS